MGDAAQGHGGANRIRTGGVYEISLDDVLRAILYVEFTTDGKEVTSRYLGEGMRAAIVEIKGGYPEMIEGWRGR